MDIRGMFKGAYIAAVEIPEGREVTLTISRVEAVPIEGDRGETKVKPVVFLKGTDRGWVLNRTNAELIGALHGYDTEAWPGKAVTVAREMVQYQGKRVPGIRVIGSPDLDAERVAVVKLPRKAPKKVTLRRTGGGEK